MPCKFGGVAVDISCVTGQMAAGQTCCGSGGCRLLLSPCALRRHQTSISLTLSGGILMFWAVLTTRCGAFLSWAVHEPRQFVMCPVRGILSWKVSLWQKNLHISSTGVCLWALFSFSKINNQLLHFVDSEQTIVLCTPCCKIVDFPPQQSSLRVWECTHGCRDWTGGGWAHVPGGLRCLFVRESYIRLHGVLLKPRRFPINFMAELKSTNSILI